MKSIVDSIVNLFNLMIDVHPMVFLWENQITNMDLLIKNYGATGLILDAIFRYLPRFRFISRFRYPEAHGGFM